MAETKISCPNCSSIAIKDGDVVVCESCDATFKVTKVGGAKLKEMGRLDVIDKRLDRIESLLPGGEPDPAHLEPDPAENEPDPANLEPNPAENEPDHFDSNSILG